MRVLHSQSEREEFETDSKQKYERERVLLTEENKKLASELDKVKRPLDSLSLSLFLSLFFSLSLSHSFALTHNIPIRTHASVQCVNGDVDIYM